MLLFVEKPNLPDGNVSHVLLGEKYAGRLSAPLEQLGVRVVPLGAGEGLDERVAHHADMCAHHLGENRWIVLNSSRKWLAKVKNVEIIEPNVTLTAEYPSDVALNVLRLGRYAFGRADSVCSTLSEHLSGRGIEFVDVQQGYAKCSVCVVGEFAAITADTGLAAALDRCGVDVLLVSPGGVALDGYDTGFIGGATGLIAPDVLAFTGRLDSHPDSGRIKAFLARHGVRPLELTEDVLSDVGSVLPLAVGSRRR